MNLNDCLRGDKIRIFGYVCYFCGITTTIPNEVFTLHVTDSCGVIRRFKIGMSDLTKQVERLVSSSNTLIERVDLYNKFKSNRPTLAYWLF